MDQQTPILAGFTPYHSKFLAHRLTLEGLGEDALARSLSTARVEMKPHQVDAVLFALQSPIAKGAILADEVGLGKTIEAGLVIAQRWAERRRKILLIVPASLRKQWSQELQSKFSIPSLILEAKSYRDLRKAGEAKPFERDNAVIIVSYEFADRQIDAIGTVTWDLVVFDEAHRLRNVHKRTGSARAKNLKRALSGPFKILLTATPLQNSLLELYGLVSIVDDHIFGDEFAFKANYMGRAAGSTGLLMLKERLRSVLRRTLRKTVLDAGHINYTNRNLMVESFEPSDKEHNLYLGVSAFLQRENTILFGDRSNPLLLMGYQKILGSSTYAIAQTLDSSIATLKRRHRASLADVADIETQDEWSEEADEDEEEEIPVDPVKLQAEIAELTALRDLARSIGANAKGERLIGAFPKILDQIVAKGGARKAVIFTESVRTQRYLRDLLDANGFAGQIAVMNGSNNDPESRAIYEDWRRRHAGTDAISGSKTADMKAAIVEAFRDQKTILIATESGAEGINLQFCSVVINFDLPWNPQRIEQRIGRCHRFGQKIDVTVVNFLNLKNRAEERVHELLNSKFHVRAQFKPQWRDLYRVQKHEAKHVANATLFERAVFVFSQRERLGLRKPLSFRQAVSFIRHPGKLLDRIDAVHERERRGLAQAEKADSRIYTETIWTQHRARADRLIAEQGAERQAMRDRHFARTRGVTLQHAKASLAAELHREPANDKGQRALTLKQRMAEWRSRNEGKDYGREM